MQSPFDSIRARRVTTSPRCAAPVQSTPAPPNSQSNRNAGALWFRNPVLISHFLPLGWLSQFEHEKKNGAFCAEFNSERNRARGACPCWRRWRRLIQLFRLPRDTERTGSFWRRFPHSAPRPVSRCCSLRDEPLNRCPTTDPANNSRLHFVKHTLRTRYT